MSQWYLSRINILSQSKFSRRNLDEEFDYYVLKSKAEKKNIAESLEDKPQVYVKEGVIKSANCGLSIEELIKSSLDGNNEEDQNRDEEQFNDEGRH